MHAAAPPFTTADVDEFSAQLHTAEPPAPDQRVTIETEPAPPAPAPDEDGDDEDSTLSVSVSAFTSDGPHHHAHMHVDEPATPAQIVDAVRACAVGLLAQLGIDPAAHGGLGRHPRP